MNSPRRLTRSIWCAAILTLSLSCMGCVEDSRPSTFSKSSTATATTTSSDEPDNTPILSLTPSAVQELNRIVKEHKAPDPWYLRLEIRGGGCAGFQHKLDLDTVASPDTDYVSRVGKIRVVVMKKHVDMFRGVEVDFTELADKRGFKIKNPNFEGELLKKWLPILRAATPPPPKLTPAELAEKIAEFRSIVKEDPDNELAHYDLGRHLMDNAEYLEAIKSFERTLELRSDFARAHQFLGECLIKIGQKDRAVKILDNGIKAAEKQNDEAVVLAIRILQLELDAAVPVDVQNGKKQE